MATPVNGNCDWRCHFGRTEFSIKVSCPLRLSFHVMPDIRILQHVRPEPSCTIAEALNDRGRSYQTAQIFRNDPVPGSLDGAAIRRAARTHEATLRNTARTVSGRWTDLMGA